MGESELYRLWRRAPELPFGARTFWRGLEPVPRSRGAGRDGTDGQRRLNPLAAALRGHPTPPTSYHLSRSDGTSATVQVAIAPIRDGSSVTGAVITVLDESSRAEAERFRDAFLGILGHELRTPITSIVGGAELLRHKALADEFGRRSSTRWSTRPGASIGSSTSSSSWRTSSAAAKR